MSAHWQVVRTDADQPWRVRLVGGNGEIVLTSESYADERDAVAAAQLAGRVTGYRFEDLRT